MNVLVTKINFLGDMVSFLPTLRGIAEHVPRARVLLVCTPVGREIAEGCFPQMAFHAVDYKRVRSLRTLRHELVASVRACRVSRPTISLHSYDEPSFSYLLAATARIPVRIGFDSNIARFQRVLTETLPFDTARNVVDINFDLVRRVTGSGSLIPLRTPLRYTSEDEEAVARELRDVGVAQGEGFVAIHGGAKFSYREWGVGRYLELAQLVERRFQVPVVFVDDGTQRFAPALRLVETRTVRQLACLLDRAVLFIGNNSGPMNVAAAMGTPCLVVQGPSAHNWHIRWSDVPARVLRAGLPCVPCERLGRIPMLCQNRDYPHGCMREITVERVERCVGELVELPATLGRSTSRSCAE